MPTVIYIFIFHCLALLIAPWLDPIRPSVIGIADVVIGCVMWMGITIMFDFVLGARFGRNSFGKRFDAKLSSIFKGVGISFGLAIFILLWVPYTSTWTLNALFTSTFILGPAFLFKMRQRGMSPSGYTGFE